MSYFVVKSVKPDGSPEVSEMSGISARISEEYTPIMYGDYTLFSNNKDIIENNTVFSTKYGCIIWKSNLKKNEILYSTKIKGTNLYRYSFEREYEAVNHFDIFNGKESIDTKYSFIGADNLKYTFGIEYETACGMIPENECFKNGLIPLRDGSITGPEYSTIILKGNNGVNLVKQQLDVLGKYTDFNKECALHIHFGGYPVRGTFIFTLYSLLYTLQEDIRNFTNQYVFSTKRYKNNGKDYCKPLPEFCSFSEMYECFIGQKFTNSLRKPHPRDIDHNHKWQIDTRYYWVNFINILCYENPKTVEFRFLRPSYNFTKIYTWILVLNGILMCAEQFTRTHGASSIETMYKAYNGRIRNCLNSVYQGEVLDRLFENVDLIYVAEANKRNICDGAGSRVDIDDKLLTFDYIK